MTNTKKGLGRKLWCIMLAVALVVTMMPMAGGTAYAAGDTRIPEFDETFKRVCANGNHIYIVGDSDKTSIYYFTGSTPTYLVKDKDLSEYTIYGGFKNENYVGDVNISMEGGKVKSIYGSGCDTELQASSGDVGSVNITISGGTVTEKIAATQRSCVTGDVNITVKGGSINDLFACPAQSKTTAKSNYLEVRGNVNVYITGGTVGRLCGGDSNLEVKGSVSAIVAVASINFYNSTALTADQTGRFTNLLYLDGSEFKYKGNSKLTLPEGITLTVAEGQSLEISSSRLTNNGTIINNGTLKVTDKYTNNGTINNNGTLNLYAPITGSGFGGSGTVNCYAAYVEGISSVRSISVKMDGSDYSISSEDYRLQDEKLYIWLPSGDAQVTVNSSKYCAAVTAKERVELKKFVAVSGLGDVPSSIIVNAKVKLPTVSNSDASYKAISWSFTEGQEKTGATITNGMLTATTEGTFKLKATVKNGSGFDIPYEKEFTVKVEKMDESNGLDISAGSITIESITKDNAEKLKVSCSGFGDDGYRYYEPTALIVITGTTTENKIMVKSGKPNIVLKNCSITIGNENQSPFEIQSGAKVNLTLVGTNKLIDTKSDGYTDKCNAGLHVADGAELVINGDGELSAQGGLYSAGIGGGSAFNNNDGGSGGTITIDGGTIEATSISGGAAIGAGYLGSGGTITINGGTIEATSEGSGAGIGGGYKGSGGNITINGGTITARSTSNFGGAGIGGGYRGSGGTVAIKGGNIKATASDGKAQAIGTGRDGSDVSVTDGNNNSVSLQTLTLNGVSDPLAITEIGGSTYGINDVSTLDTNKLYFYLPSDANIKSITAGGKTYICKDSNNTYYTAHDYNKTEATGLCTRCGEECKHTAQSGKTCSICGKTLHTHSWTYTTEGTTVIATCSNADNNCSDTDGGSVTLKVSDAYYTGKGTAATVSGSFTNGAVYNITYDKGETGTPSSVGSHTAKLTVSENNTAKANVTAGYTISYLPAPETAYNITNGYKAENNSYWFKGGDSVTISAPSGYTIATTLGGTYGASVSFSENDDKAVYLKNAQGEMTDKIDITENISFDKTAPTGKIEIMDKGEWKTLLNKISFGIFFKGDKAAIITSDDSGSGVKSIKYYIADSDLIADSEISAADAAQKIETAVGTSWNEYKTEISLNKNAQNVIYVRITDNVGNVAYINSEGVVLYTDAAADTESIATTYKAGVDKTVNVTLNGNTIKSIANGTAILVQETDYTVNGNTITLKAAYLNTLSSGEYTFTISYNPLGVEYKENTKNEEPATTEFALKIEKANGAVTNISDVSKTYDGSAVNNPTYTSLSTGTAVYEYKAKAADDSTYTATAPSAAGTYTLRISVAADENYEEASATKDFTISNAELTDVSVKQSGELSYTGEPQTAMVTAKATAKGNQSVKFTYSDKEDGTYTESVPAFKTAGSHKVYYKAAAANHNEASGSFDVKIEKQPVTEPTIASKAYTGENQTADVPESTLYSVTKNQGGTKVGEYDVELSLTDSQNYKWSTTDTANVTLKLEITKAANAWTTEPAIESWTYGQAASTPTGTAKFGDVKISYSGKTSDGKEYNSSEAPTERGTYTAIFTVEGTDDYDGLSREVSFSINRKSSGGGVAVPTVPSTDEVTSDETAGTTTSDTEIKLEEKTSEDGSKETTANVTVSDKSQDKIIDEAKKNDSKEIILDVSKDAVNESAGTNGSSGNAGNAGSGGNTDSGSNGNTGNSGNAVSDTASNVTEVNVKLDKDFIESIIKDTDADLTIKTPFGDKTYTQEELKELVNASEGGTISLTVTKAEVEAEQNAAKIEKVKKDAEAAFGKVSSSKTSKGNIKLVYKPDKKTEAFIKEMKAQGYTVKYRFYRSTKKSSGYKAMKTKTSRTYVNTSGKSGTRYYYKVQVRIYDENGKLVAKTALKQCKYATRIFG